METVGYLADIRLWERISDGEEDALTELFRKYYRPLLNYGLNLISSEALVKDSIQDLFVSIWEQRENLSDVEYVRSYLYISLRRILFRLDERQKAREKRDEIYSKSSFQKFLNKEKLMILNELEEEQRDQLESALQTLSKRQKEAVFLKFYNGLSASEIAQVMEVNKQSVFNHLHRAIKVLKEVLD